MICIITWRKLGLTRSSPGMLLIVIPGLQQILLKFLSDKLQQYFPLSFLYFSLISFNNQIKTKYIPTFCSRLYSFISNLPLPLHKRTVKGPSRQISLSNDQKRDDMILIPFLPFSVYNNFSTKPECLVKGHLKKRPRSLIMAQKDSIVRKPKMPETFGSRTQEISISHSLV